MLAPNRPTSTVEAAAVSALKMRCLVKLPEEIRLIGIAELCAILGRSRASVYRDMERDSNFPRKIRITGSRSVRWRMGEVIAYVDRLASLAWDSSRASEDQAALNAKKPLAP